MLSEVSTPTLIAEATRLQGDITFLSGASIFGLIEGNIIQQSSEEISIGKSGWIFGSINSQGPVYIEGKVEGNVVSSHKIKLFSSAMVMGKLTAPTIELLAGAIFQGEFEMRVTDKTDSELPQRAA